MPSPRIDAITPVAPGTPMRWVEERNRTLAMNRASVGVIYIADSETSRDLRRLSHVLPTTIIEDGRRNVAALRNAALQASRAEFVGQFDADDLHVPGAVDVLVKNLEDFPNSAAAFGHAVDVDEHDPTRILHFPKDEAGLYSPHRLALARDASRTSTRPCGSYPMLGCAGIWRREWLQQHGGWNEEGGGRLYEENEMLLAAAAESPIILSRVVSLLYRRHPQSLIHQAEPHQLQALDAKLSELEGRYRRAAKERSNRV